MEGYLKTELRFVIDALSPETLSFGRLVKYLNELNRLFGEAPGLHFDRVASGSAALVAWIDKETQPKVSDRLRKVNFGSGPTEAVKAIETLNDLLREDHAVGVLNIDGAEIIPFPGRAMPRQESIGPISQSTSIEGQLVRIGGKDKTIPFLLLDGERSWSGNVTRTLAKEMGHYLFGPTLRVMGSGDWRRDSRGQWSLVRFNATDYEVLNDRPLSDALSALRELDLIADDAYEQLKNLRGSDDAE